MSRGRKAIVLDKMVFQATVTTIENEQKPTNRSQLWKLVEQSAWAKNQQPRPLTAQVAYIKAKELGINIVTPIGKKGEGLVNSAIKKSPKKISLNVVDAIKKHVPEKYQKYVKKAVGGSMKAAIRLKCLDCSNYQQTEIRECGIISCSLYPYRPYRGSSND